MNGPTLKDRLLPSLLDRLTDNEPRKNDESRDQRVATLQSLREAVLRDLEWLMNTVNLESVMNFDDFPELRDTVINYGMPGLAGNTMSNSDRIVIQN